MEVPRVPQLLVAELVEMALRQIETEILFYLNWEQNHWRLNIPNQTGGAAQVIPLRKRVTHTDTRLLSVIHTEG
jgi:hypothetical protein